MLLTTIIVSYNTKHLLDECLSKLRQADARIGGSHCVVVDNASRDGSADHLTQYHPEVQLIRLPENIGFGRANNVALPFIQSPYVLLLNTDAMVPPESIEASIAYMEQHPRCGILGARLVGRDGSAQPSARWFPTPWNLFLHHTGVAHWFPGTQPVDPPGIDLDQAMACDWVPGCYFLMRKPLIDQVGLFDPLFFLYAEEVDLCRRAKSAGWEVHYFPGARVVHIGGESAKSDGDLNSMGQIDRLSIESSLLYIRKHHGRRGLWAHVMLEGVAAWVNGLKALARRAHAASLRHGLRRWAAVVGLLRQTDYGTHPTR